MKDFITTERFEESFQKLPIHIREKFYEKLSFLLSDFRHPSLHTKKIGGCKNIWEGRVDYQYRFTFCIERNTIILRVIGNHDEVISNP